MTATLTKSLNTPGYTLPTADRPDVGMHTTIISCLSGALNAGIDDTEMREIETNTEFYTTILARLRTRAPLVDAGDIFPDL